MGNEEPVICVKNLKKSFGDVSVLKDISFSVHKGDVLGVIGPSGSGKSTMLRCITQLETVSGGSIFICGVPLVTEGRYSDKKSLHKTALQVGLVFQNFNLFPHFSVLKNISHPQIHVLGKNREEADSVSLDLLAKMGLSGRENAYPYELSGGQMQRVSIARALAMKPQVLLFDEPTSALDPELTGEILSVIRELAKEKMTMVVVTHEMAFARDLSDHIIFMDGGIIVEQGKAAAVINNPQQERTRLFLRRFSSPSDRIPH